MIRRFKHWLRNGDGTDAFALQSRSVELVIGGEYRNKIDFTVLVTRDEVSIKGN
jgi:hypothetical protein